jgi:hypothetical protein
MNDRVFCINLSAVYLTEMYKNELVQIMPYVDILFGNEQEAASFAKNVLNIQVRLLSFIRLFPRFD